MKIDVAGVLIDDITAAETISRLDQFVQSGKPHYIVTAYSEFVVFADVDSDYLRVLNQADLVLPDGIGILWAAKYLSLAANNALDAMFQLVYSGAAIIFNRDFVRKPIPEKVSGSKIFWNIAKLAADRNYSLALIGGEDGVAEQTAEILKRKFPGLRVTLAVSDAAFDEQIAQTISSSNSDILCIAYAPPKQEKWIAENIHRLNVRAAIGLGGTFDYVSGKRGYAPQWVINFGIEWLYRLITQPWRGKRMWNAIVVFISIIYKEKVKQIHARS